MKLNHGEFDEGEYLRIGKGGRKVWLKATYTPIIDDEGRLLKVVKYAYDITGQVEQQQAIERLQGEMQARQAVLNKAALVSETDLHGTITYINDKFVEVSGYTREELVGQPHKIVRHPSTPKEVFKEMWATIQSGRIFQARYRNMKKDGGYYWVDATIAPVLGADGKPEKYIAIRFDVTEQMDQQNEMEALIEAIGESNSMVEYSVDGRVLHANANFLRAMGYSDEQAQQMQYQQFCDPQYARSEAFKEFWASVRQGNFHKASYRYLSHDGRRVWLEGTMNPMRNIDGEVYKIVQYAQDVTERRLRNSENRGKLAGINQTNGAVEFDLEGNILYANDIFLQAVGYKLDELKNRHHSMLCTPEYAAGHEYREFWLKLIRGESVQGVFPRVSKGGKPIWFDGIYTPVTDDEGNMIKIVKYVQDVTETKVATVALTRFVEEMSSGNFEAEIDLQGISPKGDIARMLESNLVLRDNLKNIISEIKRVLELAGREGRLGERLIIPNASGSWYTLMYAINQLLEFISHPLLVFGDAIGALAKGDLTKTFELESAGDIEAIAQAMRNAFDSLNALLKRIQETSLTVEKSAHQMIDRASTMSVNTSTVMKAIEQISSDMDEQVRKTEASSLLVQDVLSASKATSEKTGYITKSAEKGMERCESGIKIITNLVQNMDEIAQSATSTSTSIEVLAQRSDDISRTLNVITEIAAQTNLLALNAAIEAARAGDAGRGFAVVAEEIRKLAEDSKQSANEIDRVIKDVQKDVNQASSAIQRMRQNVTSGNVATKQAQGVFEEIASSSHQTLNISKEMGEAATNQQQVIDAIVRNIQTIVQVSMQTAQGTEEVTGAASILDGSMLLIHDTTQELASIAEELRQRLSQFKLRG
jgi:PAS domain S-box-containing protein